LPQKDGYDRPLFDYEQLMFDSLIGNANADKLSVLEALVQ